MAEMKLSSKTHSTDVSSSSDLPHLNEFKDAIELMFFAYRDFIADPDLILRSHDFGRAHHRVLHFVGCNPGLSIAELLEILQITKQSLARVLRDLIDGGYINQQIGNHDRRKRLLHLSSKGQRLHNELIAPQIERFMRAFADLSGAEFDAWKKVMRKIISAENREAVEKLIVQARKDKGALSSLNLIPADRDI